MADAPAVAADAPRPILDARGVRKSFGPLEVLKGIDQTSPVLIV
jgi:hypothetical protein